MVSVSHDKSCRIFTDNSIDIKIMAMFVMVMTVCIFIVIFMGWTWYWWRFTFQMILGGLNLLCCQIFLEKVMIVITVWHDKALIILTDDTIGIKTMIMVFIMMSVMFMFVMLRCLTSMVTVLLMMMVLLSRFFCWFAWILQWCWFLTVTS